MDRDLFNMLVAKLAEHRPTAIVAVQQETTTCDPMVMLDTLVESLGFKPLGSTWKVIDWQNAVVYLTRVLHYSLAYSSCEEMDVEDAQSVATEFLNLFSKTSRCFSNGVFTQNGWAGHRVAPGTFETGIACVGNDWSGILWVQDED